jgi:hypothetical protein
MKPQQFKLLFLAFALLFLNYACEKETTTSDPDGTTNNALGWLGSDNMGTVPTTVNYFGGGNLPSKVDLTSKFPPIGNQGQYGTCVAWATAYNYKTAINGMDKGYSTSQLANTSYQFSPKDLFLNIPDAKKGNNCAGTNFAYAFQLMQDRGVATMTTVPYSGLGDCSQSNASASWNSEAAGHKLKYWRKVQASSPNDIKALLADNIPVAFGATLADNFMTWNSEAVLSSNTTYNVVGQHAGHALVIAGYDDAKNAFKVINSWGKNWGASGYIWVDYNFLLDEFCQNNNGEKALFMAVNDDGGTTPPNPDPVSNGVDFAAWVFDDYANGYYQGYPQRTTSLNVYNIGNTNANASKPWSFYYIAFNAYDANDYGVLFSCDVNTSVAYGTEYCLDFNTCTYNINIPVGSNLGYEFSNTNSFDFYYAMPLITGNYYLVLYVDAKDEYAETDETNNLFYPFDQPHYFNNGEGVVAGADDRSGTGKGLAFKNELSPLKDNLKKNDHFSLLKNDHNAYRNEEIASVIKASQKDGRWDKKIAEMRARKPK